MFKRFLYVLVFGGGGGGGGGLQNLVILSLAVDHKFTRNDNSLDSLKFSHTF